MSGSNEAFHDCVRRFIAHDYASAATLALNLIQEHFYFWLAQIMLIGIERSHLVPHLPEMRNFVRDAFAGNDWELSLLDLSANRISAQTLASNATTRKRECQLRYYQGARLLTDGNQAAAADHFRACSTLDAECMERTFAQFELENPEPVDATCSRLLSAAGTAVKNNDAEALLTIAGLLLAETAAVDFSADSPLARILELLGDLLGVASDSQHDELMRCALTRLRDRGHVPQRRNSLFIKELGASLPYIAQVPFSRFTGKTRQVRATELDPLHKAALLFGFPIFLGRPKASQYREHPVMAELRSSGNGHEGSPFARRRFSGDGSEPLSRMRYHALCSDDKHYDNQTLIAELNAYSAPSITGYVVARDTDNPDTVEIVFRGLPGDPNPLYLAAVDTQRFAKFFEQFPDGASELKALLAGLGESRLISDENEFTVSIPCQVSELTIDRCLDLRHPEARAWMLRFFQKPVEGLFGEALSILVQLHEFPRTPIESWEDLLPAVNAASYGGNPLTDIFATFLRNVGAGALIFPSARNDYSSILQNGQLASHSGWNLVDYRDSIVNAKVGIDAGNPIQPRPGHYRVVEPTNGDASGSLIVEGNFLHTLSDLEQGLHEYIVLHGSEWRIRNSQPILRMKGFFWYTRGYSIQRLDEEVRCSRCDKSFSEEEVIASINKCPACGHKSDVLLSDA
jgi:hypothetical protein